MMKSSTKREEAEGFLLYVEKEAEERHQARSTANLLPRISTNIENHQRFRVQRIFCYCMTTTPLSIMEEYKQPAKAFYLGYILFRHGTRTLADIYTFDRHRNSLKAFTCSVWKRHLNCQRQGLNNQEVKVNSEYVERLAID